MNDLGLNRYAAKEVRKFNKKLFNIEKIVLRFFQTASQCVTKTKKRNNYNDKMKYLQRNSNNQFTFGKKITFTTTVSYFFVFLFLNTKKNGLLTIHKNLKILKP